MLLETLLPVLGILAEPLSLGIVGVGGRGLSLLPGSHTEAGLREKGTRKAELWKQNYFTRAGDVPVPGTGNQQISATKPNSVPISCVCVFSPFYIILILTPFNIEIIV